MPRDKLSHNLLRRAAELRVGGSGWEAVAKAVGRSVETVRGWPRLHPQRWRQALAEAEQQLLTETTAESILTLRRQLRSDDEKTCRDAADKLLRFKLALSKPRKATTANDAPDDAASPASLAQWIRDLEKLGDADLDQLIEELLSTQEKTRHSVAAASRPGRPPGTERLHRVVLSDE